MGSTICLSAETSSPEDRLAFLALSAKHAAAQVSGQANDLFKAAQAILNQIIKDVCEKRTAAEFQKARDEYAPQYVVVMLAIGALISAVVPSDVIDRLTWEAFSEMEADFRDQGAAAFGKDIADQALFTVWTLRKINDLLIRLKSSKVAQENFKQADPKLAKDFVSHIIHSRFHLDCLKVSLRSEIAIYPEALGCISQGLRSLVNAYAYIRQASDNRSAADEEIVMIDFDEEEQELLALSMKDVSPDAYS